MLFTNLNFERLLNPFLRGVIYFWELGKGLIIRRNLLANKG